MADVAATIAALDALSRRVDDATKASVSDALHIIQAESMVLAPVGVGGNSTNAPGDLKRSIDVEGPAMVGDHIWSGRVGPTTVYGRQRELGGDIYPKHSAYLHFTKFGADVYAKHVYQKPEPYMKPARANSLGKIEAVTLGRVALAITGG